MVSASTFISIPVTITLQHGAGSPKKQPTYDSAPKYAAPTDPGYNEKIEVMQRRVEEQRKAIRDRDAK